MWEVLCVIATQFATKVQLKDLTYILCFQDLISQIIQKKFFLLHCHIEIHVSFKDVSIKV
jgi:hypothetical protein